MKKSAVAFTLLLSSSCVFSQESAPVLNGKCENSEPGRLSSIIINQGLRCVNGYWKNVSELINFDLFGEVKDINGKTLFVFSQIVREGSPIAFNQWSDRAEPVLEANGALRSVFIKYGNAANILVTLSKNPQLIRIEADIQHAAGQNSSWDEHIDAEIELNSLARVTKREDGTEIFIRISKRPN